jgi:hypothetical protein
MKTRRWKWRAMDAEENQKQVSLRVHSPWKSQRARLPHSHRLDFSTQTQTKGGLAAGRFAPGSRLIL